MMNPRFAIAAGAALAMIAVGACSSGGTDTTSTSTSPTAAVSTTLTGATETTSTTALESTTTLPEPTTTVAAEPVIKGADPIEQITPTSGGGMRPLLEWVPIDEATTYVVTVYTRTGGPYWSAVTIEPKTYVGGPLQIPAGRTGPNVAEGYTWTVSAEDADGNLLAASPLRAIAP